MTGVQTCALPISELGKRAVKFNNELWIERDDFMETPSKGYFRLAPGAEVRLRYGYIVKCVGVDKDANGNVVAIHCTYDAQTKSGAETRKVKGNIHWLSTKHAIPAEVRLYDRLFNVAPAAGDRNFKLDMNPDSKKTITAFVEPILANAMPEDRFQFERQGYFIADRKDHTAGKPVFNRAVTLRDSWGQKA